MTIPSLAADIADRISEMARDSKANNAVALQGILENAGVRLDRRPMPPEFLSMTASAMDKLKLCYTTESIVSSMRKEDDFFNKLLSGDREECYKLYSEARVQNCIMSELIWAIVNKNGGSVALGMGDLAPVDWRIDEIHYPTTCEKVIRTSLHHAGLETPAPSNPIASPNGKESSSAP